MKKILAWTIGLVLVIGMGIGGYLYYRMNSKIIHLTPEYIREINQAVAAQNEDSIKKPRQRKRIVQPFNPLKNVYFGDTHVHTTLSFDAYLAGNRLGLEETYRFAQGEPLKLVTGEIVQISQPLDFVAITDHAESFGLFEGCADPTINKEQQEFCQKFETPSIPFYLRLLKSATTRPPKRPAEFCGDDGSFCFEHGKTTWNTIRQMAEKYNQPGEFTAFIGYEYSPTLPERGMLHRNVIYRNNTVPDVAFSAFDAPTVIDLWNALEANCTKNCEFLTIPHNMNFSWGLAYSGTTIDGEVYTKEDWALRARTEPLAEIFQAKGNSECGVGAVDEECGFEQFIPVCDGDQTAGCVGLDSFAREGLKKGMQLEQELGFNPLRFGFIGSTDSHNSNPGDTEEYDFRGFNGVYNSPAKKRLSPKKHGPRKQTAKNPGGLAAVWAEENTRDALFEGMKKRETYATSGTRIHLRFFGGWDLSKNTLNSMNPIADAYKTGVPMGGVLKPRKGIANPRFIIWAAKDPDAANLQRIQMIKGWIENGERREEVFDIACSDGLTPDPSTERCPDNGARVDIKTCDITQDNGMAEMKLVWEDTKFNPEHSTFYYVRVLENPTCRWSTYDAIRLGQPPRKDIPATIRERAWSSPIWYAPEQW
ncbi:MAG: DUF3604 domain-containing protein [Desulfobacula sp.]|uniref:DUF3604 domain-containing protein n=1 Tax=Desulfobacula sp. TaxID=2593537 RepID=UPI0025C1976E|nr:DUF3604 domain-containing protein [Desulfobacula sp.]MCD4719154.1 DUF3604 domain-containing protein [Desulfobacula sp.]